MSGPTKAQLTEANASLTRNLEHAEEEQERDAKKKAAMKGTITGFITGSIAATVANLHPIGALNYLFCAMGGTGFGAVFGSAINPGREKRGATYGAISALTTSLLLTTAYDERNNITYEQGLTAEVRAFETPDDRGIRIERNDGITSHYVLTESGEYMPFPEFRAQDLESLSRDQKAANAERKTRFENRLRAINNSLDNIETTEDSQ